MLDWFTHSGFSEVAVLLAMAAALGGIGLLLRQPLIVSFIAVGLVAGPSGLDMVRSDEQITLLSELGIAVLLFLVGIKLDIKLIRSLGTVSLMTGLGQVFFTSVFGFLIGLALGLSTLTSFYIAVALTFSSTIIIVKLLSDKHEIDSLHGQVALGFLIVQDLVVVLAMIALSAVGIGAEAGDDSRSIGLVLLSGAGLVALVALFVRFVATPLTERLARTSELLVIFALAQAVMIAALSDAAGLGKEVGGLLAGISLASTPYREAIAARLAPLRDFLLLFFFIALGSKLDLSQLGAGLWPAAIFSLFVLIGNPFIVLVIMGSMGFRKRTGFLAGLTVAQISEFSLIFVAMGVSLGHVTQEALGLVTLVGLVTIAASTYMITYSDRLYSLFQPILSPFERRVPYREPEGQSDVPAGRHDVVIFGLGRFGTAVGRRLHGQGLRVLGVDYNPAAVRRWRKLGLEGDYGDATDPEFLAHLPLGGCSWILSTIPVHVTSPGHADPRLTLLQVIRRTGYSGKIAVTSTNSVDTETFLSFGSDVVLEPYQDAADQAVETLFGKKRTAAEEAEMEETA